MAGARSLLVALLLLVSTLSLASASCDEVKSNNTFCVELDSSVSFAWTVIGVNRVNTSMFCVPAKPFGWCGWGISPNGGLMVGSSALCGYSTGSNEQGTFDTATRQFFLQDTRNIIYDQGDLNVQASSVEYDKDGNLYMHNAIEIDPAQTLSMIWARGVGIVTFDPPQLVQHRPGASASTKINFQAGAAGDMAKGHAVSATAGLGVLVPIITVLLGIL